MKIIPYCIALTMWALALTCGYAQEKDITDQLALLNSSKESIVTQEKEALKSEVENINKRLESGNISQAEAEDLKKMAAEKRALNIENRVAIVDNKVALLERNKEEEMASDSDFIIRFGGSEDDDNATIYIGKKNKKRKYDRRTTSGFVLAGGLNHSLIDGTSLGDSPYSIGKSRFVEFGMVWKTRILKNSNLIRLKYGLSFQWNKIGIKDDKYFVQDGNTTSLNDFEYDLKKSQLRITNLVVPVHFEFGPSKKIVHDDYFRYSTIDKFKIGIGGYAGVNIGTRQKLKYKVDGAKIKDKTKADFNATDFVYGLSGYIGFDVISLYAKYDLSPMFEGQTIEQNNISLGFRLDLD